MASQMVFDRELAVHRAGGNVELADELFGMLVKELPVQRSRIIGCLEQQALSDLQLHTHKLHGSTAYTGVPALKEAVETLERSLKRGETDELSHLVTDVVNEIDRILSYADLG